MIELKVNTVLRYTDFEKCKDTLHMALVAECQIRKSNKVVLVEIFMQHIPIKTQFGEKI